MRADEARSQIRKGQDPSGAKKAEKRKTASQSANTFEAVAREFVANRASKRAPAYQAYTLRRLQNDIFPELGARPISDITAPELLAVLRKIEARGVDELPHRVRVICGQVFRYGIQTDRAEHDVSADLRGALTPHKSKPHPAVTEDELPALLCGIDRYRGDPVTRAALQLLPMTFLRASELVGGAWEEISFNDAIWGVPGSRMKVKNDVSFLVPLSKQAIEALAELQRLTGDRKYIFAMDSGSRGHLHSGTPYAALRKIGWTRRMCVHGFRAVASTILNEERERGSHDFSEDVIERQLDHVERNNSRRPYNRAPTFKPALP